MTLYAMIVAATMVGMFDFCKMAKSGLEKRQIGKKRKEADERHATLFSFYCLPLRYILTPGSSRVRFVILSLFLAIIADWPGFVAL